MMVGPSAVSHCTVTRCELYSGRAQVPHATGTALAHSPGSVCVVSPLEPVGSLGTSSFSGWNNSMRSIGLLAAVTGTLVLASSCSEGSGLIPPENAAPVANFELPACTIDVSCEFV